MKTMRSLLFAVLALVGAGCGGNGQTGKVSLLLKDAPGDFKEAWVTISEIQLVGSGGTKVFTPNDTNPTDLLTLANATKTLTEGVEVPAGTYTELRFIITGGCVKLNDDTIYSSPDYACPSGGTPTGTLRMPSFAQSGLKVTLPGGSIEVAADTTTALLVDFVVAESFGHEAGASGAWVMHPVVHATYFDLAATLDVSLTLGTGVTLPSPATLADFHAVLTSTSDVTDVHELPLVVSTTATPAGSVATTSFKYVTPGSYTLTFTGPGGVAFTITPTAPPPSTLPVPVTLSSGQHATAAFTLSAAAATP